VNDVSCVVPVHNGRRYLAETLRSILGQTHPPLEVIVVDNGSTDDSAAIARSFGPPVTVIEQENRGPPGGRNRGIRAASGDYLAFCDSDDLFHPEKLARQVARFTARPELELSLCTAECFWESGLEEERARYERHGRTRATHAFGNLVARRDVFDRVGMLDESLVFGDQIDWFTRVAEAKLVVELLPDVLMLRRMHADSISHRSPSLDPYLDFIRERIASGRAS
jgi:glycosyltransferase involved in cell wall biosynthesis